MRRDNRQLLNSLTCMKIDKVFGKQKQPFERPRYAFATAERLKKLFESSLRKARAVLLMPPVMSMQVENVEIISKDPELQGFCDEKMIFIDSTYGLNDRKRNIWVRRADGVLETADILTRRRMLQTYFPFEGRKVVVPQMFFGECLDDTLDSGKYLYVLDRCLIQFEPYERDYHRVMSRTFEHINQRSEFDVLRSTRYFGPMAFYLAWHKIIDNLVMDCIRRGYMRNAVEAVCLMYNLNNIAYDSYILNLFEKYPKRDDAFYYRQLIAQPSQPMDTKFTIETEAGKGPDDVKVEESCMTFLDAYRLTGDCQKPNELKQVLQTYREELDERRNLLESLQKVHGI